MTSRYDDSDAKLTTPKPERHRRPAADRLARQARPVRAEAAFNSDLAFENGYAYQGNYEGVTIWDVRDPSNPKLVGQILCPGSQNDVTVNDGILVTSTDSRRTNDTLQQRAPPDARAAPPPGRA